MPNAPVRAAATGLPAATPTPKRHLDVQPNELPDRYGMILEGTCLDPVLSHGTVAMFDKTQPYDEGDLVVIFLRPELVPPGRHQGIVKRIVLLPPTGVKFPWTDSPRSELLPLVVVEQLNPHRQYQILGRDILAIHKCLGAAPADQPLRAMTDTAAAVLHRREQRRAAGLAVSHV